MKKSYRAGAIVVNENNEIALVNENLWGFPRGGIEEGEDSLSAAKREVLEETGLKTFSFIKDLGVYERYPHSITKDTPGAYPMEIHMFLFRVDGKPKLNPQDSKVEEYGWFKYDDAVEKLKDDTDRKYLETRWEEILDL
jgi:bis(5'-nucleosidyl)-tetraphosphatase